MDAMEKEVSKTRTEVDYNLTWCPVCRMHLAIKCEKPPCDNANLPKYPTQDNFDPQDN